MNELSCSGRIPIARPPIANSHVKTVLSLGPCSVRAGGAGSAASPVVSSVIVTVLQLVEHLQEAGHHDDHERGGEDAQNQREQHADRGLLGLLLGVVATP